MDVTFCVQDINHPSTSSVMYTPKTCSIDIASLKQDSTFLCLLKPSEDYPGGTCSMIAVSSRHIAYACNEPLLIPKIGISSLNTLKSTLQYIFFIMAAANQPLIHKYSFGTWARLLLIQ
jgi:hypothetical protein